MRNRIISALILTTLIASLSEAPRSSAQDVYNPSVFQLAKFNGPVQSILELANGQILVGGDFTKVNNIVKLGLARLNADGSVDNSFTAQVPGPAIPGSLDLDKRILTFDKNPNAPTIPNYFTRVWGIIEDADGYLVVADNANYYNYHFGYLRLKQDGSLDNSYRSKYSGDLGFGPIRIKRMPNGKVLLGGLFTQSDGTSAIRVAVLDKNGDFDSSFSPNPSIPKESYGGFLGMGYLGDMSVLLITGQPKKGTIGDVNDPCVSVIKYSKDGKEDINWENRFANHYIQGLKGMGAAANQKMYIGRANSFAQFEDGRILISAGFAPKPEIVPSKGQETCYGGAGSFVMVDPTGNIDTNFNDISFSPQTAFAAKYDGDRYIVQALVNFSASGGPTLMDNKGNLDSSLKVDAKTFFDESFSQSTGIFSKLGRYALVAGNSTNNLISGYQENYVLRKIFLNPAPPKITKVLCDRNECNIALNPTVETSGIPISQYIVDVKASDSFSSYKLNSSTGTIKAQKPNSILEITSRSVNSSGMSLNSEIYRYIVPQFAPLRPEIDFKVNASSYTLLAITKDDGGSFPSKVVVSRVSEDGSLIEINNSTYLQTLTVPRTKSKYSIKMKVVNSIGESEWSLPLEINPLQENKTITCFKGNTTKKITGSNPKCPSGFKKK